MSWLTMTATRYEASAVHQRIAAEQRRDGGDDGQDLEDDARRPAGMPEAVGDRSRSEVVLRRDRIADGPQQGQEVRPGADAREQHGRHGEHEQRHPADDDRPPAPGQQRPHEDEPRLDLDGRPERAADAEDRRSVQPAPADGERREQDRPDLARA